MLESGSQVRSLTSRMSDAQTIAAASKSAAGPAVIYRLYTERLPNVRGLVASFVDCATLIPALGLFDGQAEESIIVEVISDATALVTMLTLAEHIRAVNAQTSVLVVWTDATGSRQADIRSRADVFSALATGV